MQPPQEILSLLDLLQPEDQVRLLVAALINQEVPVLESHVEGWKPLIMGGFVERTSPGHVAVTLTGRVTIMQMAEKYVL